MLSALRVVTGTDVGRNLRTRGGYVRINTLIVIKLLFDLDLLKIRQDQQERGKFA